MIRRNPEEATSSSSFQSSSLLYIISMAKSFYVLDFKLLSILT